MGTLEAAQKCLEGVDPASIGMVVTTSSTALGSPYVCHNIIKQCKLSLSVQQATIFFAGCGAGVNALRMATTFARANPGKKALFLCYEASSIHAAFGDSKNDAITHCLFADAAMAGLVEVPTIPKTVTEA